MVVGKKDIPSMTAGMSRKLIPCTIICSRQFVRLARSFRGGRDRPLTRKMKATAP